MGEVLITTGVGLVSSFVSALITWIFAKRRYNAEVDGNIIENMQKTLDFYENLSDDNKKRLDDVLEENKELREENKALKASVDTLTKDVNFLKDQLIKITSTICMDLSCQLRKEDYSTLNIINDEETKS